MTDGEKLISVAIPVKNGDLWIEACIEGIMSQTLFPKTEIVVVDSGSTDNTLNILKKYPVRLYTIPAHKFNHGTTRNYIVNFCEGEFIVMTVQDAIPAGDQWLEKLLQGFTDESVVAVCGQQIVDHDPDKNPIDWYRPVSQLAMRKYQFPSSGEFDQLSPSEKKAACSWDNVTTMYRREILLKIPFAETVFGEDMIWAKDALLAGRSIVYNPSAKVYHYHFEDQEYVFKRTLTTYYFRYKQFGLKPADNSLTLRIRLSIIKTIFLSKGLSFGKKLGWWRYNISRRKAANKAYKVFSQALTEGENALDMLHEKYCKMPPVPLKVSN